MDRAKTTPWIIGTGAIAVVILAGAYLGVISPKLGEVRDTKEATADALAHQDLLRQRLASLKADHAKIDEYRAELAGLRLQIPEDGALPAYVNELQALAVAHGVTIVALAPGTPTAAESAAVAAGTTPEPTEGTDPAATEGGETAADTEATDAAEPAADDAAATDPAATDPAADAASSEEPGLVTVPVSITVVGTYQGATGFLSDIQTVATRLFHVRTLTTTTLEEGDASGGRPATALGDVEMVIDGFMLVLPGAPEAPSLEELPVEPPPLPQSDRNPFSPVV